MAFAKLSGSLLASNDAPSVRALAEERSASRPVATPPPGPQTGLPADEAGLGRDAPNPVDVGQLYEALRDCIDANDQEGISRVFAHLVRAGQPISAIADMVEALSKGRARDKVDESRSILDDSTEPGPALAFEQD